MEYEIKLNHLFFCLYQTEMHFLYPIVIFLCVIDETHIHVYILMPYENISFRKTTKKEKHWKIYLA